MTLAIRDSYKSRDVHAFLVFACSRVYAVISDSQAPFRCRDTPDQITLSMSLLLSIRILKVI